MTFGDDMVQSRPADTRYFVEVKVPGAVGGWLKASTNHATRPEVDRSLDRMQSHPLNVDAVRRVGAEVVLRYAVVDPDKMDPDLKPRIDAQWSQGLLHHLGEQRFEIPLQSAEVGDITLQLTYDQFSQLAGSIINSFPGGREQAVRNLIKEATADD